MNKAKPESDPRVSPLVMFLCACCAIGEVLVALGFLIAMILIPLSEKRVAAGRERMAITIAGGTLTVGFKAQFGSPSDNKADFVGSGSIRPGGPPGSLTFGPLRLKSAPASGSAFAALRPTDGLLTVYPPEKAAEALAFIRWPFLFSLSSSCVLTAA